MNQIIHSKRNLLKACLSGFVEWYDFGLYLYMVPIFSSLYFSNISKAQGIMYALLIFASSYLVRPIGGVILGYIGDKYNRKCVLMTSTSLMMCAMLIITILPVDKNSTLIAISLLIVSRLIQGLSVGGQYVSLYVFLNETSKPKYLGSTVSLGGLACGSGMLAAAFMVFLLYKLFNETEILLWGFRIPFIIGITLSILTLILQTSLVENYKAKNTHSFLSNIKSIEKTELYKCGLAFLICGFVTSVFYFTIAYIPNITAININAISGVTLGIVIKSAQIFTAIIGGLIYDKYVNKEMSLFISMILSVIGVSLSIIFIAYVKNFHLLIFIVIFMAFSSEFLITNMFIYMNKVLNGRLKLFLTSLTYNIASSVFGGFTPAILVYLSENHHTLIIPIFYLVFAFIGMIAIYLINKRDFPKEFKI